MKRQTLPEVDVSRCTGCGWCVASCHLHLLSLEPQGWRKVSVLHDADKCTACRKCEARCPFGVIRMRAKAGMPPLAG